jgi:hypothetical protein
VPPRKAARRGAATAATPRSATDVGARATELAADLDRAVAAGRDQILPPEAVQALTAALCRVYSARIDAGEVYPALAGQQAIAPTEVLHMASGLLRASGLAVFELGMWQSWTGR